MERGRTRMLIENLEEQAYNRYCESVRGQDMFEMKLDETVKKMTEVFEVTRSFLVRKQMAMMLSRIKSGLVESNDYTNKISEYSVFVRRTEIKGVNVTCYKCGRFGHIARYCRNQNQVQEGRAVYEVQVENAEDWIDRDFEMRQCLDELRSKQPVASRPYQRRHEDSRQWTSVKINYSNEREGQWGRKWKSDNYGSDNNAIQQRPPRNQRALWKRGGVVSGSSYLTQT